MPSRTPSTQIRWSFAQRYLLGTARVKKCSHAAVPMSEFQCPQVVPGRTVLFHPVLAPIPGIYRDGSLMHLGESSRNRRY